MNETKPHFCPQGVSKTPSKGAAECTVDMQDDCQSERKYYVIHAVNIPHTFCMNLSLLSYDAIIM